MQSDANLAFKERYYNHFGQRAPTLNALGQSTYEGVHFMAALAKRAADDDAQLLGQLPPMPYWVKDDLAESMQRHRRRQ